MHRVVVGRVVEWVSRRQRNTREQNFKCTVESIAHSANGIEFRKRKFRIYSGNEITLKIEFRIRVTDARMRGFSRMPGFPQSRRTGSALHTISQSHG
jgi:hypothetical protein